AQWRRPRLPAAARADVRRGGAQHQPRASAQRAHGRPAGSADRGTLARAADPGGYRPAADMGGGVGGPQPPRHPDRGAIGMSADSIAPDAIRLAFSDAMSAMYRAEVPLYGDLLHIVAQSNAAVLEADPALRAQLAAAGELER